MSDVKVTFNKDIEANALANASTWNIEGQITFSDEDIHVGQGNSYTSYIKPLKQSITNLTSLVDTNATNITNLGDRVGANETNIANLGDSISTINTNIETINTTISNLDTNSSSSTFVPKYVLKDINQDYTLEQVDMSGNVILRFDVSDNLQLILPSFSEADVGKVVTIRVVDIAENKVLTLNGNILPASVSTLTKAGDTLSLVYVGNGSYEAYGAIV